ncbi:hypothetical protein R80B4_01865 [Fibrobacteres bacterium R8-0-B4]
MNIRSKIMLSIAVGAVAAALAVGTINVFNAESIAAIAAIISAFCAAAAACGLLIADSITKPLNASVGEMSRRLAETASMTTRNADTADRAKSAAAETLAAALAGEAAMKRVTKAIKWIKASSDNNAKIIKTVNYMATRANILAFNTAIMAARGGGSGGDGNGFAFTAKEMRNFALRCSATAKSIGDMIEESAKEADDGVKTAEDAAASIGKTVKHAGDADSLTAEIAAASSEYDRCVKRVAAAAALINRSARQNAAAPDAPAGIAEKTDSQTPDRANAAADEPCAADQPARPSLSERQKQYAAFPYKRTFSAATLAFWVPMRPEAEEMLTIDDVELWR